MKKIENQEVFPQTMFSIKGFFELPETQRKFMSDYLDMINTFRFTIKHYRVKIDDLAIQNTDLWIESYIHIVPELQEFRDFVRNEMARLGIERHPKFVYKEDANHYFYTNKREIEKLKDSL